MSLGSILDTDRKEKCIGFRVMSVFLYLSLNFIFYAETQENKICSDYKYHKWFLVENWV